MYKRQILYLQKPHIGTDVLSQVVKNIREHIIALGGQVRFGSQVTDILTDGRTITGVVINGTERLETDALILAIGHSARDTFEMLLERQVPMQQKSFAIGLRIQHPQKMITQSQYGTGDTDILGPASYKLTKQTSSGRGVYSFCMCPGGYVAVSYTHLAAYGVYQLIFRATGTALRGRLGTIVCLMPAILVAVLVYFVLLVKLRGVDEDEMRGMPGGTKLIGAARKLHLM